MTDPWQPGPPLNDTPTQPAYVPPQQPYAGQPAAPYVQAPVRRGMPPWLWAVIGAGAVVALLVVGGVVVLATHSSPKTQTFTATGTLTVSGGFTDLSFGSPCHGIGGYSDVNGGAQVVVYDAAGASVAIGSLYPGISTASPLSCSFDFTVKDIPGGKGPYSVEVSHRGKIAFQQSGAGDVELTLGDGS